MRVFIKFFKMNLIFIVLLVLLTVSFSAICGAESRLPSRQEVLNKKGIYLTVGTGDAEFSTISEALQAVNSKRNII